MQDPQHAKVGAPDATGFLRHSLTGVRSAALSVASKLNAIAVYASPVSSSSSSSSSSSPVDPAVAKLRSDIRLITFLSAVLIASELSRVVAFLRRPVAAAAGGHAVPWWSLVSVWVSALADGASGSLAALTGPAKTMTTSTSISAECMSDDCHSDTNGDGGGSAASGASRRPGDPEEEDGSGVAGEEGEEEAGVADDEEEEEEEEKETEEGGGGDKDIRNKTPLQMIHYWKQVEKAVLTGANRQPFAIPLPEATTADIDPHARQRRKELLPAAAAAAATFSYRGGCHTGSSPTTTTTGGNDGSPRFRTGCAPSSSPAADGSGGRCTTPPGSATSGTDGVQSKSFAGRPQLTVLVLPVEGCFIYEQRPDVLSFAWRDADNEAGRRIKADEEMGERMLSRRRHNNTSAITATDGAHGGGGGSGPLRAPTSVGGLERLDSPPPKGGRSPLPSQTHTPGRSDWEALLLIWGMSVDYRITIREVRQLLVSASPPALLSSPALTQSGGGPTPADFSSANLSLLWFLANLRLIYESIVVHGDIHRSADDMEELDKYLSVIYKKCIARWPGPGGPEMAAAWALASREHGVPLVCNVRGTWQVLSVAYEEIKSIRFKQSLSGVWQLARYIYASSKTKYVSALLIAALTALNSRITSAGRLLREEINTAVTKKATEVGGGEQLMYSSTIVPADSSSSTATTSTTHNSHHHMGLALLCGYELGRLVLNYILVRTTSEFIALAAGLRKDAVRAELYEALAHIPLDYFDVRTFDEIESIIYSVDDLEGIDVQINQYVFTAVNSLWMVREALADTHSSRVLLVAATTATLPHVLAFAAKRVKAWYDDLLRAGAQPWLLKPAAGRTDAEEEAFNTDGVLLRGTEIIGAVHQLRPYGADTRLTHWWNQCTQYQPSHPSEVTLRDDLGHPHWLLQQQQQQGATAATGRTTGIPLADRAVSDLKESGHFLLDAVRSLMVMPYGKLVPAIGKGALDMADWVLPIALNVLGARWCGLVATETFRLLDCATALESGVDVASQGVEMAQMILENGYKASMLERVLDATLWETTSIEESRYLRNYVNARGGEKGEVAAGNDDGGRQKQQGGEDGITAAAAGFMSSSRSSGEGTNPTAAVASPLPGSPPPQRVVPIPVPSTTTTTMARPVASHQSQHQQRRLLSDIDILRAPLYRHYIIHTIHFHEMQFRYPSSHNINAFQPRPFTATLRLLDDNPNANTNPIGGGGRHPGSGGSDSPSSMSYFSSTYASLAPTRTGSPLMSRPPVPHQGGHHHQRHRPYVGRLVCLTGHSGSGKSTALQLLLALYTGYSSDSPEACIELELTRRHGHKRPPPPPPGSGAVSGFSSPFRGGGLDDGAAAADGVATLLSSSPSSCYYGPGESSRLRSVASMTAMASAASGGGGGNSADTGTGELMRTDHHLSSHHGCCTSGGGGGEPHGHQQNQQMNRPPALVSDALSPPPQQPHQHQQQQQQHQHPLRMLPPCLTIDVRYLPVDVLRTRYFSYVPQAQTIFNGVTIAQNISLASFVSIATDGILQKVEHCARLAQCSGFIKKLPSGLLTRICDASSGWCSPTGADGRAVVRLTPGQLQCVSIARALYHGGQVLLMDEPTAGLEAGTAAAMRGVWASLLSEGVIKGIVCATQDAELLAMADQIVELPSQDGGGGHDDTGDGGDPVVSSPEGDEAKEE